MKLKLILLLLVARVFCLSDQRVKAQTSLLNAPSTDVVAPKKIYVEMDFITNYAWQRDDARFANYLPRAVVGVGKNTEVGANVSFTQVPGGGEPIEIQPNAKWQFYANEEKGLAAAAGCIWFIPLTHRAGTDTYGQCYSVASKQFQGNYGPRITGGAYGLVGASKDQGTKGGAIVAWEQPLTERFSFIVDWQSGYNRLGYLSPGLNLNLPRNTSLSGGYAIANKGHENNALFVYFGQQF